MPIYHDFREYHFWQVSDIKHTQDRQMVNVQERRLHGQFFRDLVIASNRQNQSQFWFPSHVTEVHGIRLTSILTIKVTEGNSDLTDHTCIQSSNNLAFEVRTQSTQITVHHQVASNHWISTDNDCRGFRHPAIHSISCCFVIGITIHAINAITQFHHDCSLDVFTTLLRFQRVSNSQTINSVSMEHRLHQVTSNTQNVRTHTDWITRIHIFTQGASSVQQSSNCAVRHLNMSSSNQVTQVSCISLTIIGHWTHFADWPTQLHIVHLCEECRIQQLTALTTIQVGTIGSQVVTNDSSASKSSHHICTRTGNQINQFASSILNSEHFKAIAINNSFASFNIHITSNVHLQTHNVVTSL